MTTTGRSFRDEALAQLAHAFGPPRVIPTEPGLAFYRWILDRPCGLSVYLTLNCPESAQIAHLILSDPKQGADPVVSITIRTMPQVSAAIERIIRQWRNQIPP